MARMPASVAPSRVPISSHTRLFCNHFVSVEKLRMKRSWSHHNDGERAAHLWNTSGYHLLNCSEIKPPIDDPQIPVCSASGRVRYHESIKGFTSSTRNRPYSLEKSSA